MNIIFSHDILQKGEEGLDGLIGGKGVARFKLYKDCFPVPRPVCIGTSGYELFVEKNHLREKIQLLLHRKDVKDLRWEEIWDISLRIQNPLSRRRLSGKTES